MWWSADREMKRYRKAAQPRFSPVSGPFWVRIGVRGRVRVRDRGWVGFALVTRSHKEVLPRSQTRTAYHTAPNIRATRSLRELHFPVDSKCGCFET